MSGKEIYEEYKVMPQIWGWILLVLFAIVISGFGIWAHHGIPDPPRYWDRGELPDTPAESVYSIFLPPPLGTDERVISPLPESKSLEEKVPELGRPGPPTGPGSLREEREGQ